MRRDVFQAIADPTRREIIGMLASQSLNLNSVAEHFDVSRPAISKHIKILTECGLITITQQGRERYCEAKLEKLNEVSDWVEKYKKFWTGKLDALEIYLMEMQAEEKSKKKSSKKSDKLKKKKHGRKK
ncbi:MAG: ArsR family transcriptional regulator [Bacteroidetes bacterium]|nr:ArsR family transcriptional regulator [Bacteroidota bacterium]